MLTMKEFLARCQADFNLPEIHLYKEKASHMMTDCKGFNVELGGPEVGGYRDNKSYQCVTVNGWGFALVEGEWQLLSDGQIGWRQGENPLPTAPEFQGDLW